MRDIAEVACEAKDRDSLFTEVRAIPDSGDNGSITGRERGMKPGVCSTKSSRSIKSTTDSGCYCEFWVSLCAAKRSRRAERCRIEIASSLHSTQ